MVQQTKRRAYGSLAKELAVKDFAAKEPRALDSAAVASRSGNAAASEARSASSTAALGNQPADQPRRRDVKTVVRDRRARRHEAHRRDALVAKMRAEPTKEARERRPKTSLTHINILITINL
jgi:hypothetical protein